MEIISHPRANKTHFHKRGCARTWPHFESDDFWNLEVAYKIEFWAQLFARRLALTRV